MTPITKIPLETEPDTELESIKDSLATQRALDYYLKPSVSQHVADKKMFLVSKDASQEEVLLSASEYMRCAIANGHSTAEHLQGPERDQLLSLLILFESSSLLVNRAIDILQLPPR